MTRLEPNDNFDRIAEKTGNFISQFLRNNTPNPQVALVALRTARESILATVESSSPDARRRLEEWERDTPIIFINEKKID